MKDMTSCYNNRTSKELRTLRSKKVLSLMRLEADKSWMAKRDAQAVRQYIVWIDAVLASREAQERLF